MIIRCADYMGVRDVVRAHAGFTYVVTIVSRLSVDGVIYRYGPSGNVRRQRGRPKQECILLMT